MPITHMYEIKLEVETNGVLPESRPERFQEWLASPNVLSIIRLDWEYAGKIMPTNEIWDTLEAEQALYAPRHSRHNAVNQTFPAYQPRHLKLEDDDEPPRPEFFPRESYLDGVPHP